MVLGAQHFPRTEQDRERREHRRDQHRAVDVLDARRRRRYRQHLEAECDGFQLQRDVRQHAYHRDRGDEHCDRLMPAVARADEVGDRRDVVALGDADDALQQRRTEHEHDHGAEVDRQKIPAVRRSVPHRAVERPRRAIDADREAVYPRLAKRRPRNPRAPIAVIRDGEQDPDIDRRDREQGPAAQHRVRMVPRWPELCHRRARRTPLCGRSRDRIGPKCVHWPD